MTPSIDDQIASVIRALSDVILPALPAEASLAQEQAQLAMGHLQILRAQIDHAPQFELEELNDALGFAQSLAVAIQGGANTQAALGALNQAIDDDKGLIVRDRRKLVNEAIEGVVRGVAADGSGPAMAQLTGLILEYEEGRVKKDRAWRAPFGFDTIQS